MLSSSRSLLSQNDIVNSPRLTTRTLSFFRTSDNDEDDKEAEEKGEEDTKVMEVATEGDMRLLYWRRGSSWISI